MRDRIAEAAIYVMSRRGLKFSIRELTARLGISTKTLYQYFESKEQLVGYIVDRAILDMREKELRVVKDPGLNPLEKLKKALVVMPRGFAFANVELLNEFKRMYPEQWVVMDDYMNKGWDRVRAMVQEGMENGMFRRFDIEVFIQMYVGSLYQFMEEEALNPNGLLLEKKLTQMVDLLLHGVFPLEKAAD
ncbi:TetR/AcrR family transcriptional regulator [Paenibacillus turpanensis]|uniref:TetR/AcrR family transcriptional regulator n=1 Tax=Paenibacillus turpanensis TaxID=2689078 RepID=UPI00140C9990|nr:TetR/AcrR family transcriptional regulator [Paenibacillus turpanensis]